MVTRLINYENQDKTRPRNYESQPNLHRQIKLFYVFSVGVLITGTVKSGDVKMDTVDEYDKLCYESETRLKPLLTKEFLDTLIDAVRTCGWSVDHIESSAFVFWCLDVAGDARAEGDEGSITEPYQIP